MTKKQWVIVCVGLVAVSLTVFVWTRYAKAPVLEQPISELSSVSSTTPPVATTSTPIAPKPAIAKFQINPADTIASWSFKGAYVGNDALVQNANDEIVRLTSLIGSKKYPDYTLYIGISNQYNLLGDGKNEFAYLKKALAIDSTNTGLAWHNIGQLFSRLGAYATARTAFERAATAEPISQYRQVLADFLAERYPDSVATTTSNK